MSILTFGESLLHAAQVEFSLVSLTAQSPQSAFNTNSFVSGPVSEFWRVAMTIAAGDEDSYRALRALLTSLRAGRNKLRIYDPSSASLRGAGGASPTINIGADAVAGAESITLKNLTASQTVALAADDKIGIGENLYMVVSDCASDGSGEATVSILPALRLGVAEDDPVDTLRPTGLFRLMSKPSMVILPGSISQPVQLEFMEDPELV